MLPFKFSIPIQVRFRDTDAMGHVNNAVYLSYFELARMHYWKELTSLKDFSKVDMIVARVEIDYRSPAFIDTSLRLWIRTSQLKRSSFTFEYRLENPSEGRLIAEGRSVQCFYDYSSAKVRRMDKGFRDRVLAFENAGTVQLPG